MLQNPHKNTVRNAAKKMKAIEDLQGRDDLNTEQEAKLRTAKKVAAELATAEKNFAAWDKAREAEARQAAQPKQSNQTAPKKAAAATPAAKKAPDTTPVTPPTKALPTKVLSTDSDLFGFLAEDDKKKYRNLLKKLRGIEQLEEKDQGSLDALQKEKLHTKKGVRKDMIDLERRAQSAADCAKAATAKQGAAATAAPAAAAPQADAGKSKGKKTKPEAPAAPAAPTPEVLDDKAIKTMKNRAKNLANKVEQIELLRAKPRSELTKEQIEKVKTEKASKAELASLQKKLADL